MAFGTLPLIAKPLAKIKRKMESLKKPLSDKEYDFIFREMNSSWEYINNRRVSALNFFKIYSTLIVLLGTYVGFVNSIRIDTPDSEIMVYGFFGLFSTIVVFMTGWGLLDTLTRITAGTIKQYKHLIQMRSLIAENFPPEVNFEDYSINLLKSNQIPISASRHIPILGACFNGLIIFLCTYFLNIIFDNVAFVISSMSILLLIAILFYSNVVDKHYYELLIAQRTTPKTNEIFAREILSKYVKKIKKQKKYSIAYKVLVLISILFLISTFLIAFFQVLPLKILLMIHLILFVLIGIVRFIIGKYRVENIQCRIIVKK